MQLFPIELAFENLKGTITKDERGFMLREDAYELLKEVSGEEFPIDDLESWAAYVSLEMENHPPKVVPQGTGRKQPSSPI